MPSTKFTKMGLRKVPIRLYVRDEGQPLRAYKPTFSLDATEPSVMADMSAAVLYSS